MTRPTLALLAILAFTLPAKAGLHYSREEVADLPAKWRGLLLDLRDLRFSAVEKPMGQPASPLREEYLADRDRLLALKKERPLTTDEVGDLGAIYVRLGEPDRAVDVLRAEARSNSNHFKLMANLGSAWQATGNLEEAIAALSEAVRVAPPRWKPFEEAHLKLVKQRWTEARRKPQDLDDLFGVKYVGAAGKPEAGKFAGKLPQDAVAIAQQLALWMPADGRLLWQLGELANAHGDVRTAAAILDGCVTEFKMPSTDLRARRTLYRDAAEALAKEPGLDTHKGTLSFKSDRGLIRRFDESQLPPIRKEGVNPLPWAALAATKVDEKGRAAFLHHIRDLDGKSVSFTGFMQPLRDELELTTFLLIEYPVGCWFCESPELNGMVLVEMKDGRKGELKKGLVRVEGTLSLNRDDPEGFLFTLKDAKQGEAN